MQLQASGPSHEALVQQQRVVFLIEGANASQGVRMNPSLSNECRGRSDVSVALKAERHYLTFVIIQRDGLAAGQLRVEGLAGDSSAQQ